MIILWNGVYEWESFDGTTEEAIAYVKAESRYLNYGHRGAVIVKATTLYAINEDGLERRTDATN